MKKVTKTRPRGFVLITSMVVVVLLMMLGVYYLNFTLAEYRIAKSQAVGIQDYYLAEAGVHEMIWRLKNDATWKNNFETNSSWSVEFTRSDDLLAGGSYTVSIQNTDFAQGEIVSTGTMVVQGQTSQRVIKATAYKAIGEDPTVDLAIYENGNVDFNGSIVNVINGGIFSNNNIQVDGSSTVNIEKKLEAVNQIIILWGGIVTTGEGMFSQDYPPAPDPMIQPAADFDSEDANSLKNQAIAQDQLYTENEFEDFLDNNPNPTLDGVHYVTGRVNIKRNIDLIIN
ncbi:hypothetical protein KKI23_02135, partial [Patescibacteria group bacterium]|nr:hypothetical protein [Patescibacteria group bacterium]